MHVHDISKSNKIPRDTLHFEDKSRYDIPGEWGCFNPILPWKGGGSGPLDHDLAKTSILLPNKGV